MMSDLTDSDIDMTDEEIRVLSDLKRGTKSLNSEDGSVVCYKSHAKEPKSDKHTDSNQQIMPSKIYQ